MHRPHTVTEGKGFVSSPVSFNITMRLAGARLSCHAHTFDGDSPDGVGSRTPAGSGVTRLRDRDPAGPPDRALIELAGTLGDRPARDVGDPTTMLLLTPSLVLPP